MLRGLFKTWKMAQRGLLSSPLAAAQGFVSLVKVVENFRGDPDAPYFARMMAENNYLKDDWKLQYVPRLQAALDKDSVLNQIQGMRALAIDCIGTVACAVEFLADGEDSTRERAVEERAMIASAIQPSWSVEQFVDNELGNCIVFEASRVVTLFLAEEYFNDGGQVKYATACDKLYRALAKLTMEKYLSAAKGVVFARERQLNWLQTTASVLQSQIVNGRNISEAEMLVFLARQSL